MIETPDGPTVEGAGPGRLRELLREFEAELREYGVPVDETLAPGADPVVVRARFDAAGLDVPNELVEWFAWHDGPADLTNPYVLPGIAVDSLERTLRSRASLEMSPMFGDGEFQWRPEWLQFAGDDNGLAMRLGGDRSAPPLVRSLGFELPNTDPDFTDTQVVSLCTPVTIWMDDVRTGARVWDPSIRRWRAGPALLPQWRRVLGY
jgi:hypothetical protein